MVALHNATWKRQLVIVWLLGVLRLP